MTKNIFLQNQDNSGCSGSVLVLTGKAKLLVCYAWYISLGDGKENTDHMTTYEESTF